MKNRLILSLILLLIAATLVLAVPSNTVYTGAVRGNELAASREARRTRLRNITAQRDMLVRAKVIRAGTKLPRFTTFVVNDSVARTPRVNPPLGNGAFTFAFTGWTADEETALRAFLLELKRGYSTLVSLYGAPASNATVNIIRDDGLAGTNGGEISYDSATGNINIRLEAVTSNFTTDDSQLYGLYLLNLLAHGFHMPATIGFDAWEDGMAKAAALLAYQNVMTFNYDQFYYSEYLLPTYDNFNQPELSTPTFFPPSGNQYMSVWREGMALSAWLKVYIENPSFFKDFNTAYYQQYNASATITSNLASLKTMANNAASHNVEGKTFLDWYPKQYVLVPEITLGNRLFFECTPAKDTANMVGYYFNSSVSMQNGQQVVTETPLGGTVNLTYTAFDGLDITQMPAEGYSFNINASGISPGMATFPAAFYNIGNAQRVKIQATIGGLAARTAFFAYNVQGSGTDNIPIWGVLDGADSGTLYITISGGAPSTVSVNQGVFSFQRSSINFFAPTTLRFVSDTVDTTYQRNIGPQGNSILLKVAGTVQNSLRHTFPAGLSMISFPLTPQAGDAKTLFDPLNTLTSFKLAYFDPTLPATGDQYHQYPAIGALAPGQGYWVSLSDMRNIELQGLPPTDAQANITLQPGWNMIGNLNNYTANPWAMTVQSGIISYRLSDAMLKNLVSPVWMYNSTTQSYEVNNVLQAWEGAWLYNKTGGTLTLRQDGAARSRDRNADTTTTLKLLSAGGWGMALQAQSGSSSDTIYLGVSPKVGSGTHGLDWVKPPRISNGTRLAFTVPVARTAGAVYASDIRPMVALPEETWEFEVTPSGPQTIVSWPEFPREANGYRFVLEDLTTGGKQEMRTTVNYGYTPAKGETARRFRVHVTQRTGALLNFTKLQVTIIPRGLQVDFALNTPADLQLEIRTMAGKPIRTLNVPASEKTVIWDGRDSAGNAVPHGTYQLNFTARTAEGAVTHMTSMAMLK